MSKAGCPYENAPTERYYNTFKNCFYYRFTFESEELLDEMTQSYVNWHNYVRPHSYNKYSTPMEARFLGYDIRTTPYSNEVKRTARGCYARNYGGHVQLEVPTELARNKLLSLGTMRIRVENATEIWRPIHRGKLIARDDLSILDQYNGEVRGFCNYYDVANNKSKLHKFRYIMEYSMVNPFCCKYRCHKGDIFKKHRKGKDFYVEYKDRKGNDKVRLFWKGSLKRGKGNLNPSVDIISKPRGIRKKRHSRLGLKAVNVNGVEWKQKI